MTLEDQIRAIVREEIQRVQPAPSPEHPKYRLVFPTTRDMTADEHAIVWTAMAEQAAARGQTLDKSTRDPSRLWYVPAHREGANYEWRELTGTPIDVDAILAAAPAKATSTAPATAPGAAMSPSVEAHRKAAAAALGVAWPAKGTRHDAKRALAGALWRDGLPEADALAFAREVYVHVDSADGGKLETEIAATYARAERRNVTGWRELGTLMDAGVVQAARDLLNGTKATEARLANAGLVPVPVSESDSIGLPTFPVEELPLVLRRFVVEQALSTECPADFPAMFVLGACSAAIAGKVDLEVRPGYVEPLNLFIVVGAKTGERKSPIHAACFGPLMEAERAKVEAAAPLVATMKARRELLQKSLVRRQTEFANLKREDVPLELSNFSAKPGGVVIEKEIAELAVQVEQLKVPAVPRLLVADVTVERLASLMGEQGGRMCLASDEGTILSIVAGRYSKDGRSSFDVLLQGYSGSPIRVDRQSTDKPPVYVRRPRLVICIAVQPEVIEKLSKDETMRSQGLLARLLFALPTSMVGHRPVAGRSMPEDVRFAYESIVRALAAVPTPEERGLDDIPRIKLSPEANALHLQLQRELEPRLDPKTGDLAEIVDWASKYAGNVARIAGVLHCIEYGPTGEVSGATMARAIRIGEYLLAHALAAFGSMGKSSTEKDAEALLTWATKRAKPFTVREARQLAPRAVRGDKKRLADALEYLQDVGRLRMADNKWSPAA